MLLTFADDFWTRLIDEGDLTGFVALSAGLGIAALWILLSTIRSIIVARSKEATKREIAAYVAEGSLDPKDAVAMLEAGKSEEA